MALEDDAGVLRKVGGPENRPCEDGPGDDMPADVAVDLQRRGIDPAGLRSLVEGSVEIIWGELLRCADNEG
jgi:hypothetical protein